MRIIVIGNSTVFSPPGFGYLDLLKKEYGDAVFPFVGSSYTSFHFKQVSCLLHLGIGVVGGVALSDDDIVICSVGTPEAFSLEYNNFIKYCDTRTKEEHWSKYNTEEYHLLPVFERKKQEVKEAYKEYINIFSPQEFRDNIFLGLLFLLSHTNKCVFIGVGRNTDKEHRIKSVDEYNSILLDLCTLCGLQYIDTISILSGEYYSDDSHFNIDGSKKIFGEVKKVISQWT